MAQYYGPERRTLPTSIPEVLSRYEGSPETALISGSDRITYQELFRDAREIARALVARGIGKGDRIVLDMHPGTDYIRMCLGVFLAGGIRIAIHAGWPARQREMVLSDCAPALIVGDADACEIRREGADMAAQGSAPQLPELHGRDPFRLIYTSGSTGLPKGILCSHALAVATLVAEEDPEQRLPMFRFFMERCSRLLMDADPAFSLADAQILLALLNGKTLVLASDEERNAPEKLAACIKGTGVDATYGVISRYFGFLKDTAFRQALENVRLMIFGGEKADPGMLAAMKRVSGAEICAVYGSSEALGALACFYHGQDQILYSAYSRGNPAFVLDEDGPDRTLPGKDGEICVGGPAGMYGSYWQNPELTKKKYVDHPVFGRILRTGDLARPTEDGRIQILGRKDHMAKLHGQRIEPAAVENAMEAFPGIRRAAVKLQEDGSGAALCGYYSVIGASSESPQLSRQQPDQEMRAVDQGALRRYLTEALPYYMVPSRFLELPDLPLNPNGKLDYRALPPIEGRRSAYVAPGNPREELLCKAIASVLALDVPVGVDDDFFALGGDSIRAIAVATILRNQGFALKSEWIFAAPTVRQLASMLVPCEERDENEPLWSVDLSDREREAIGGSFGWENVEAVYPPLQGMMQYLRAPRFPCWRSSAFLMPEGFGIEDLKGRLAKTVAAHQPLRSVFPEEIDGKSLQVVLREWEPRVFLVDLRSMAAEGDYLSAPQEQYLRRLWQLYDAKPFSTQEVMFEAGLIRVSQERSVLFLTWSHLLLDGTGVAIVRSELADGAPILCDAGTYNRYVRLLCDKNYQQESRRLWREHLRGHAGLSDISFLGRRNGRGGFVHRAMRPEGDLVGRVQGFCEKRHISLSACLCMALGKLLMRLCHGREAGFFCASSGRDEGRAYLTGMLAGAVPVFVGEEDSLSSLQEQLLFLAKHPVFEPWLLAEATGQMPPEAYVFLSVWNFVRSVEAEDLYERILDAGVRHQEREAPGGMAPKWLSLGIDPSDGLKMSLYYSEAFYDSKDIEGFCRNFWEELNKLTEGQ